MGKLNRLILFLFFSLIMIGQVSCGPPSLPVWVHGKVKYNDGSPVGGILVKASYLDANNQLIERIARTLTLEEADKLGNKDLEGSYKFTNIESNRASDLIISVGEIKIKLNPNPGLMTSVPDLIVSGEIRFIGDKLSSQKSGGIFNSLLEYISDFFGAGQNSDNNLKSPNPKELLKNNGTFNYTPYNYSENESYDNLEVATELYPKVTQEEDSSNGGDIFGGEPGDYKTFPLVEGELNKTPYEKRINFIEIRKSFVDNQLWLTKISPLYQYKPTRTLTILSFIFLMVTSLIILFLGFFAKKTAKIISEKLDNELSVSIRNINKLHSSRFMNKKILTLDLNATILDALEIFMKNNINIIPVISSKNVVGVITKKGLLNEILNKRSLSIEKTKVKEIINRRLISCKPSTSIADIYSLMIEKDVNEVVIENDSFLLGTVDYFDILHVFYKLNFKIENPPTLREAMSKEYVSADAETDLEKLFYIFLSKKSEYAIITRVEKPVGIVTIKDLISAVNSSLDFKKTKAVNIMSSNLVSMTPGTSVYEAFKLVLERRFNQIPIVMENKVAGVVTIKYLVKMYFDFISELNTRIKFMASKKYLDIIKEKS